MWYVTLRAQATCCDSRTRAPRCSTSQVTQTLSLVVYPAIGYAVAKGLWQTKLNEVLVSGLVVCLSTSTTASTNVVFTKQAGGNEALSLVNAILGNVIGIFLTPAWIKTYLAGHAGGTASVPYSAVIQQLVITVVAPLIVGNAAQHYLPSAVAAINKRINLSKLSSVMILLLVWSTFSNTFAKHVTADGGSVVALVALTLGFYCVNTAFALWLPISCPPVRRFLRASEADAVAMAMVAGTKTVALGIPIITAIFAHAPQQGLLSLPLIMYHAEQILLGNLLTEPLKRWVKRCEQRRVTENMDGELEGTEATTASGNSIDATPAANGHHDMEDGHANGRT
jgi:solute carrier family 10 (sodium/bile acid cotransporter), member 7